MARKLNEQEALDKVGGHFKLTALLEKRYKELLFGSKPLVETESKDVMDTLLREVVQEKIELVSEEEAVAAAARALMGEEETPAEERSVEVDVQHAESLIAFFESPPLLSSDELAAANEEKVRSGIYAWYFDEIPPGVPEKGLCSVEGWKLLYIGMVQNQPVRERLLSRHYGGNAEESTLRKSLGSLLRDKLDLTPRKKSARSKKWTFGDDEDKLTEWMHKHARVKLVGIAMKKVKEMEEVLIKHFSPPLNIEEGSHPFAAELEAIRKECGETAT